MKKQSVLWSCILVLVLIGCARNEKPVAPADLDRELRRVLAANEVTAAEKPRVNPAKAELGRLLFFDKILSGNQNISCATCHLPQASTSDALPLSIGEGGTGAMTERIAPRDQEHKPIFAPRNAQDLFNRGNFTIIYWDGRVMAKTDDSFRTPARDQLSDNLHFWTPAGYALPEGLDNALAAQAMFPPTAETEMRGNAGENPVAAWQRYEWNEIWVDLWNRIWNIAEYRKIFREVYPDVAPDNLSFVHAANAIAAFQIDAFTLTDAPFDQYLRGADEALSVEQKRGALLFHGKAQCGSCHAGTLMSDQKFHNRVVPQIGPGKGDLPGGGPDGTRDPGRAGFTGWTRDFYSYRTPPLRNVAVTGPWMHDGVYSTLRATVLHELDPLASAQAFDPEQHLPDEYAATYDADKTEVIASMAKPSDIEPVRLNDEESQALLAFLESLTSPSLDNLTSIVPERVPSGLPVED